MITLQVFKSIKNNFIVYFYNGIFYNINYNQPVRNLKNFNYHEKTFTRIVEKKLTKTGVFLYFHVVKNKFYAYICIYIHYTHTHIHFLVVS